MSLACTKLIVGLYYKYLHDKFQNSLLRSLVYGSFFKVLATVYCAVDKESNHLPSEERVLLLISQKIT
jgi:hypothetical protein